MDLLLPSWTIPLIVVFYLALILIATIIILRSNKPFAQKLIFFLLCLVFPFIGALFVILNIKLIKQSHWCHCSILHVSILPLIERHLLLDDPWQQLIADQLAQSSTSNHDRPIGSTWLQQVTLLSPYNDYYSSVGHSPTLLVELCASPNNRRRRAEPNPDYITIDMQANWPSVTQNHNPTLP